MVTQIFKGESLTRTKVKNNILKIWDLTNESERYHWYRDAWNKAAELSEIYNIDFNKVIGVIASLSPLKTWEQNLICAEEYLQTGYCGHIGLFLSKAESILRSDGSNEAILEILNGRKISAFYINIKYPYKASHITIDRHALSIGLGRWVTDGDYRGMTARQYEFFSQCYVLAAMQVGVEPLQMQSATWVKWRNVKTEY